MPWTNCAATPTSSSSAPPAEPSAPSARSPRRPTVRARAEPRGPFARRPGAADDGPRDRARPAPGRRRSGTPYRDARPGALRRNRLRTRLPRPHRAPSVTLGRTTTALGHDYWGSRRECPGPVGGTEDQRHATARPGSREQGVDEAGPDTAVSDRSRRCRRIRCASAPGAEPHRARAALRRRRTASTTTPADRAEPGSARHGGRGTEARRHGPQPPADEGNDGHRERRGVP